MRSDVEDDVPDGDEIALWASDVLASQEEIEVAIRSLCLDISLKKRLLAVAGFYLDTKPHLKRQCEPEDLLFEALGRIAQGFRKWPKSRLDFRGLVIGVIRSWASSREKTLAREDDHTVMEHELTVTDREGETLSLEEVATDGSTSLTKLEARERDAETEGHLAILRAKYDANELPAKILDAVIKGAHETHEEIIEALKVSVPEYRNAWKRLLRAAEALKSKEN
jgi:hypothetical protein